MKKKIKIGCLIVILYCIATVLFMHFGVRRGFFEVVGSLSTLHGGNPGYRRWHGMVMDDVTAPMQLPIFCCLFASQYFADRLVPSRREEIAFRTAAAEYGQRLDDDLDACLLEVESVALTNAPARSAWRQYTWNTMYVRKLAPETQARLVSLSLKRPEYMMAFYPLWYVVEQSPAVRLAALDVIAKVTKVDCNARSAVYAVLKTESLSDEDLRLVAARHPEFIQRIIIDILNERRRQSELKLRRHNGAAVKTQ